MGKIAPFYKMWEMGSMLSIYTGIMMLTNFLKRHRHSLNRMYLNKRYSVE